MKSLKIFIVIIILSAVLLFACNSKNGNANTDNNTISKTVGTSTASSSGDASFSYKIDGHVFSGKGTDNYFNCVEKNPEGLLHFSLTSLDFSLKNQPQFHFSVAENGTTTVTRDDMDKYSSGNNVKYFAYIQFVLPQENTTRYSFDSTITVTITSNSPSGVSGTISGNILDPDKDKMVQLTDGVFNLPYKTTK